MGLYSIRGNAAETPSFAAAPRGHIVQERPDRLMNASGNDGQACQQWQQHAVANGLGSRSRFAGVRPARHGLDWSNRAQFVGVCPAMRRVLVDYWSHRNAKKRPEVRRTGASGRRLRITGVPDVEFVDLESALVQLAHGAHSRPKPAKSIRQTARARCLPTSDR